ncbi:MAG: hypothetical protein U9R24_07520 [Thermodesulfobacteriota bacterium]|nr:hypothetical protein [Thermodesulfobacteriota bacterium]
MDFFFIKTITIPLFQVATLLLASTIVLLFGRAKLALLICYLFTMYWGYFANADRLVMSGLYCINYGNLLAYFGFGFIIAILAAVGFFLTPDK